MAERDLEREREQDREREREEAERNLFRDLGGANEALGLGDLIDGESRQRRAPKALSCLRSNAACNRAFFPSFSARVAAALARDAGLIHARALSAFALRLRDLFLLFSPSHFFPGGPTILVATGRCMSNLLAPRPQPIHALGQRVKKSCKILPVAGPLILVFFLVFFQRRSRDQGSH